MRKEAPRRRISLRTHGWHALNLISRNKTQREDQRDGVEPLSQTQPPVVPPSANPRATAAFRALAYTERHSGFQIRSGCGPRVELGFWFVGLRSSRPGCFPSPGLAHRYVSPSTSPQPEREHRSGRMGRMSRGYSVKSCLTAKRVQRPTSL